MPLQGGEGGTAFLVIASGEDDGQLVCQRARVEEVIDQAKASCET
jgi:hypothetical protein